MPKEMEEKMADADAGEKLDKILSHLDSLGKRMDAMEAKDAKKDASEEEEPMADAEDKEEYEDASEYEDAECDEEAKDDASEEEEEGEPKRVAADKRKKADEDEDMPMADKKKDAKADSELSVADRIARVERMIPKQISDADYAKMADAQAKADAVYMAFGDSAPRPLQGESLGSYRRRLASGLKAHSPSLKDVNLMKITDKAAYDFMEQTIFADALNAAMKPTDLPEGQLREIREKDVTGRVISRFVGEPRAWMGTHSARRRLVTGLGRRD